MEFETLRKSHKKEILIGVLAICVIGGTLTYTTSRAKYKLTEDLELVNETMNYKNSDKVLAMYKSEDGTNYTEITDRMPTSGYIINEEKSYCTLDNKNKDTNAILKTIDGNHVISNLAQNDKCYLYFDKELSPSEKTLAKLNITANNGTPTTFVAGTTTDEGVYSVSDPVYGGTSYYWRGLVTNNYVKFADKCWRIIRINGDGTIRLIYDGTTCHANGTNSDSIATTSVKYNINYNQSNYVGWTYSGTSQRTLSGTASNAKTQLENWYTSNLSSYASKIADGKYCNDRNVQSGSTWAINGSRFYYVAYKQIYTDHSPSLACNSGDVYTLKVGLITVDEAMYAGGTDKSQTSYYLYNGQYYWTMSPYYWSGSSASVYAVDSNGYLGWNSVNGTYGLRPVINLKSDTLFATGGNGTQSNPYVTI